MTRGRRTISVPYPDAGRRAQLAERFSGRARVRRHERFFAATGIASDARILDVGCGVLGLRALEPDRDITGTDIVERPTYPGPFVLADAAEALPFADGEFDLVVLLERDRARPAGAARVVRARAAPRGEGLVRADAGEVVPHRAARAAAGRALAAAPAARALLALGAGGRPEEVELLSRSELEALFGAPVRERLGPLTKSWISIRPVRD